MTNETTASQPKSIGDDAQFLDWLKAWSHEYENRLHDSDVDGITKQFASYIDNFRAPAAQVSATIQAAPGTAVASNGMVYHNVDETYRQAENYEALNMWLDDKGVPRADRQGAVFSGVGRVTALIAATIQEPVMVAEPVGLKLAAYRVTSPNTGKERLMKKSMAKVWDRSGYIVTPLYEASAEATPMVADPAGVAANPYLWIDARPDSPYRTDRNMYEEIKQVELICATEKFGHYDTPLYLAATVKAVPSEALEYRTCCDHPDCATCAGRGGFYRAAPMAEKTGGGE